MKRPKIKLFDFKVNLRDIITTKSQDFSKCANCYEDIDEVESKTFLDKLCVDDKINVNIVEALTDLFELPKKIHLSSVRLDEKNLRLCSCCLEILQKLYVCQSEFVQRSQPPSFINSVVKHQGALKRSRELTVEVKEEDKKLFVKKEEENSRANTNLCENVENQQGRRKRRINYLEFSKHGHTTSDGSGSSDEGCDDEMSQEPEYAPPDDITNKENSRNEVQEEDSTDSSSSESGDEKNTATEVVIQKKIRKMQRTHKMYGCEVCSERFARTDHLLRHMSCHSERNFICPICDAGFTREKKKEDHLKTHEQKDEVVVVPTSQRNDYSSLMKKISNEQYECTVCGKVMPTHKRMRQHVMTHRNDEDRSLVCEVCGSAFKTKASFKIHQSLNHEDVHNFICNICDKSFKRKQQLKEHEAIKHNNLPKLFVCPKHDCKASFHRLRNLKEHSRKHSNLKYPCELGCGALFTYKYNRKTHQERYCTNATSLKSKRIRKKKQHAKQQQEEETVFSASNNEETSKDMVVQSDALIPSTSTPEMPNDEQVPDKTIIQEAAGTAPSINYIHLPQSIAHLIKLPAQGIDLEDENVIYEFVVENS